MSALADPEPRTAGDTHPLTLLIYVSVPLYRRDGEFCLEDQACNGLRRWLDNFDRLIVVIPLEEGPPPPAWVPLRAQLGALLDRVELVTVPSAYRPDRFLRALPATVPVLLNAIACADLLGFAIGGLFGDWGAVGAFLALRMGLPFYVWTDRVESAVTRLSASAGPWRRRLRARLIHRPMAWVEHYLIRRAALGLFHGQETYEAYAPFSPNPHVVHNVHIHKADHIGAADAEAKAAAAGAGPLRICYAGRVDPMKGPSDWLAVLEELDRRGVDFEAAWFGEGSELAAMRARVAAGPLAGRVRLPGFVRDRAEIAAAMRAAHLMLFCHKTPESPRCLIEALAAGCPIVGYDSAFPRDLIAAHGGGLLTPRDDPAALAEAVAGLGRDRERLGALIRQAALDGGQFDDEAVFRHRSELIKAYLPRAR